MHQHVREAMPDDARMIADFNSRIAIETEGRPLDAALIDPGVEAILLDSGNCR